MAKLVGTTRLALGCVVAGAVAIGVGVAGCSGDDTAAPTEGGVSSSSSSGGVSSSSSSSGGHSSSSSSGGGSSSSSSGGGSSSGGADAGDAGHADADASGASDTGSGADVDGGTCTTTAAALLAIDRAKAAAAAAEAGTDASEASTADATTEASSEASTEASAADASRDATANDAEVDANDAAAEAAPPPPVPRLLHSFDDGVIPAVNDSVDDSLGTGFINTVGNPSFIATDGNSCFGALKTFVTFPANAQTAEGGAATEDLNVTFLTSDNWTGYTKLHVNAKILVSGNNYLQLNGFQVFVSAGAPNNFNYVNQGTFQNVPGFFGDGAFHEVTLLLQSYNGATAGYGAYDPTQVHSFGVQLIAASPPPTGAPTTAPVTTLLVDDIWLE